MNQNLNIVRTDPQLHTHVLVIPFVKTLNFAPLCSFEEIEPEQANACLAAWGHQMGKLRRGNNYAKCHALFHEGRPIAVTTASTLIRKNVGGGLKSLTRANTIELSRLCAERPGLCRVALRLWREFVFPTLGYDFAISYQDADLHNGNTYRFDGWIKLGYSQSGKDSRSGRQGRNKWIWGWGMSAELRDGLAKRATKRAKQADQNERNQSTKTKQRG